VTSSRKYEPRNFFLNETHQFDAGDKTGGGRSPEYLNIKWAKKAERLSESIKNVVQAVEKSKDPLGKERFFVIAEPVAKLEKKSSNKKIAPDGIFTDTTVFGGSHGKVFDRLGLDLLQVTDQGKAVVHGNRDRLNLLLARTTSLETLGLREQSRWVTIDSFDTIPSDLRVDTAWLKTLKNDKLIDVIFELQPVLGRVDGDRIIRAVADVLSQDSGERLTGSGTDFSGRFWFRGKAYRRSIREVAKDFFSVQSIHSPLYSVAAATATVSDRRKITPRKASRQVEEINPKMLPCVAVLDLGVPSDHVHLSPYCRGRFTPQGAQADAPSDHGSFVASRIVFGKCDSSDDLYEAEANCCFYDVSVWAGLEDRVNDKIVMEALKGVRGAAPDVRVFNLSFGDKRPMSDFSEVEHREKRLLMQDLDNFAFKNDVLIVVAAGNSRPGVSPASSYPNHFDDPRWALGPLACGFNTLVCGAFVSKISTEGIVSTIGWPSPFTRVGPGLCEAPIPSFCAEGGNSDSTYNKVADMGVWGFSSTGMAEDRIGTSYAAPLLSRAASIALHTLQGYCVAGTRPYAVAVRAFLALTAKKTTSDASVSELARRTLGYGEATSDRLTKPKSGSAIFLWQGIIDNPKAKVRVQFPVPGSWLEEASQPVLRLFVSYDPPVNESAKNVWACRKVSVVLHPSSNTKGIRSSSRNHVSYPLLAKDYKLSQYAPSGDFPAESDMWELELSYEELFDYPPGMEFSLQQRVAFAAELIDESENPVDPQTAIQALPIVATMNHLSIESTSIRNAAVIRARR